MLVFLLNNNTSATIKKTQKKSESTEFQALLKVSCNITDYYPSIFVKMSLRERGEIAENWLLNLASPEKDGHALRFVVLLDKR